MFQAIGFVIRFIPVIVAAVQFVENFVKPGADGATKKALAVRFVVDTVRGFGVTVTPRTEEVIGAVVNLTVTVLNAFGIFTTRSAPVVAPAEIAKVAAEVAVVARAPSPDEVRLAELETALTR